MGEVPGSAPATGAANVEQDTGSVGASGSDGTGQTGRTSDETRAAVTRLEALVKEIGETLQQGIEKLSGTFETHTHSVFEEPTTTPSGSGGQSAPTSGGGTGETPPSVPEPTGTPPGAVTAQDIPAPTPEKPAEAARGSQYRSHRPFHIREG